MRSRGQLAVETVLIEPISDGKGTARLPIGKIVTVFPAPEMRERAARLEPGARVILELSPYDLSRGRIVAES